MSTAYKKLGEQIGALTDEKNAAYGSSFAKAGDFLRLLYPDGIRPEQYGDMLLIVRIFDKQMRIATDKDALGESPYQDIAGYGILGAMQHNERTSNQCGTASEGAGARSMERADSAALFAATPTSGKSNVRSDESSTQPSKPPLPSTSAPTSAPVLTATDRASAGADVRARNKARSILEIMRRAGEPVAYHGIRTEMVSLGFGLDISQEITCLETLSFIRRYPESGFAITEIGLEYLLRNGVYEL